MDQALRLDGTVGYGSGTRVYRPRVFNLRRRKAIRRIRYYVVKDIVPPVNGELACPLREAMAEAKKVRPMAELITPTPADE